MSTGVTIIKNTVSIPEAEIQKLEVEHWRHWILETCNKGEGRIVTLFAAEQARGVRLYGVVGIDSKKELQVGTLDLPDRRYPSLTPYLPEAHLFEREMAEQHGVIPEGHPWLKPVRVLEDYPFYTVEGAEVHEVGVGPVHAGIIEPGHFRFQCHGEKVLHLEIQLGYQHRGVEQLMLTTKPSRRSVLAESIAGDTVIGHGLAYCHAIEGLSEGVAIPQRAKELQAIALELERLANHAGDLSALSTDIGFLPASAYFGRLRGEFLNLLMELTGNRFGRSFLRPGGVLCDLTPGMGVDFKRRVLQAGTEMKEISELFFDAASVQVRLERTGVILPETARALGLVGLAARASNLVRDVRHQYPTGAYQSRAIAPVRMTTGDVYARARVRSLESQRSCGFILEQLDHLTSGKIFGACTTLKPSSLVISLVEGWRGEIAHVIRTQERGEIVQVKIADPSFHNWFALAMAMRDGQISDFPLCNKSFNLSYAGHDL